MTVTINQLYAGSDTFTTAEESIANDTSATTAQSRTTHAALQVVLEVHNITSADVFRLTLKEKTQSSSTQRVVQYWDITRQVGSSEIFITPAIYVMHGWDVLLKKVSGSDRVIAWSIRSP